MELQDELRQAQVNLAHACAQNEVQAARQEVAEQKYELLAQQMALLEQHKDLLKQQVQSNNNRKHKDTNLLDMWLQLHRLHQLAMMS